MNAFCCRNLSLFAAAIVTAAAHGADTPSVGEAPASPATPAPAATPAAKKRAAAPTIIYKVPSGSLGGAPVREAGGTRSGGNAGPALVVLAPNHVALTSQTHPTLFWYQSEPAKAGFELTLVQPKTAKPVLAVKLDAAEQAGIRAISLAQHGVELTPGVEYRWHVALIPDEANRSKDEVSVGGIKLAPEPEPLRKELDAARTLPEKAAAYAKSGYWYDALQALSSAIAADPNNKELHGERAALLKEGGLDEAAKFDRR